MDEQLARLTIGAATRSARELGDLVPILKDHCAEDLYTQLKPGFGAVIYEIYESILGPIFASFPNLKKEFDQNVEILGRGC
jgi:hypothetical protein